MHNIVCLFSRLFVCVCVGIISYVTGERPVQNYYFSSLFMIV